VIEHKRKSTYILWLLIPSLALIVARSFVYTSVQAVDNHQVSKPQSAALRSEQITVRAAGRGNPYLNLRDGHDLLTTYVGKAAPVQILQQDQAHPTSLASADFDEDGVPDLVSGYSSSGRGLLALYRGNVDSIYPNAPEAKQHKAEGTFVDSPFFSSARVFEGPEAADFLEAGDFDSDGHWDVVTAARGSALLHLFSGNGRGDLKLTKSIQLPGAVTAVVAGEVNRRDGLTDLGVGILGQEGSQVLVFESPLGALRGEPEVFSVPAEVTAMAIGQLDKEYSIDLAVATGSALLVIHGRDRKLSVGEAERSKVPQAVLTKHPLESTESTITSIALGNFTDERQTEMVVLLNDGKMQVVSESRGKGTKDKEASFVLPDAWSNASRLMRAKISSLPHDDLVLVDQANHQIHILGGEKERESIKRVAASLEIEDEPVAVLPMRLNSDALDDLVILRKGQTDATVTMTSSLSTFLVNSTADGSDCDVNDGVCSLGNKNPNTGQCVLTNECTLRAAIQQANASAGIDAISFSIGLGTRTIAPLSDLPLITSPVIIDGTTQPGYAGSPLIELNGTSGGLGAGAKGLFITAGSSTVRGLVINRLPVGICVRTGGGNVIAGNYIGTDVSGTGDLGNSNGVEIHAPNNTIGGTVAGARNVISGNNVGIFILFSSATGNQVQGNYIGTDVNGTTDLGNQFGVAISGTSSNNTASENTIGGTAAGARNIISGNSLFGIQIFGQGNLVQGNYIGTDVSGTAELGNAGQGVTIDTLTNNTIGGTTAGARNVISGNNQGIHIVRTCVPGNQVQGNYIGTNVSGTVALGNFDGVLISNGASNNLVGGTVAEARNIISGNRNDGVVINSFGSPPACAASGLPDDRKDGVVINSLGTAGNQVQGNYIGTDVSGVTDLGNGRDGVFITGGTTNNYVGGTATSARNIISGNNGNAVEINGQGGLLTTGNQVQGNFIGTQANGTSELPNTGHGVFVSNLASNNTIGGTNSNAGNKIQNNGGDGVFVASGTGNAIVGNSISGNAGLGIDLGVNGVTPNDPGDVDSGANNLQNFPVLTSVFNVGGNTTIQGTINSTANTSFTLNFYSNSQCDASGFGEGKLLLGSAAVTTDSAGNANFDRSFPVGLNNAQVVTATATDPGNNTSEFSACRAAFKLKINFTGTGSGLVKSIPNGIFCNGGFVNCEGLFGGNVTLQAFASANSNFLRWDKGCTGSNPNCTVVMDRDKEVDAVFVDVGEPKFEILSHFQRPSQNFMVPILWRQTSPVSPITSLSGRDGLAGDWQARAPSTLPLAAVANVKIELSRNGGATFETLFASTPNDGSECWLVTGPTTTQALLRISSTDNPSITGISELFEIVNSGGVGALTPVDVGPGYCADLSTGDGRSQIRGSSFFADRYSFSGSVGQQVAITLTSPSLDTYLYLLGPDGSVIAQDNDGGGATDARIPAASGFLALPATGTYVVEATSFAANTLGGYQLRLDSGPLLFAEENSQRAIALGSVIMIRDPFSLVSTSNFSSDQRTRVSLFAVNLGLLPGESLSAVTAQAEDSQHRVYPLAVEYVGSVPNFGWLTQINVRLPDELANAGDVWVSTSLRGVVGNRALINIR
jgi:hypothetical protein